MEKKPHLSLIIPACGDEAGRLPLTLIDADRYLQNSDFTYEIVVVRNHLVNEVATILDKLAKFISNVKIISVEGGGRGSAVRSGMLTASGKYRAFVEADNSISVDQIIDALPYFKNGYDVIVGSRNMKGGRRGQPWYKVAIAELLSLFVQALLLPGIWDAHCPLKIFRDDVAEKIFSLSKVKYAGFDVEVLSIAKKMGYKIKQVPVVSEPDYIYYTKPVSSRSMMLDALKTRFWLWRDRYQFYMDAPPK